MAESTWKITETEVAAALGVTTSGRQGQTFLGIGTDTRKNLNGQLFFALRGENHDAHAFLAQAVQQGATGLVVDQDPTEDLKSKCAIFRVQDTLQALQSLATWWRRKNKFKVIAITGSNGKTSTKEYAMTLISSQKSCFASQGSFNNHWGVPLSILSASPEHEVLVLEMGMNHLKEIERLVLIAEPDIVVCTMVGRAHIGELGSQENIAKAKEEIYLTREVPIQIFNLDNEWTEAMWVRATARQPSPKIFRFAQFKTPAEVSFRAVTTPDFQLRISGQILSVQGEVVVPIFGRQNVTNLMAAAALALAAGLSPEQIWQALPGCRNAWGRSQVLTLPKGPRVLFDAYNANPESMASLVRNLIEVDVAGKKVAVLGEMLELGHEAAQEHFELGRLSGRAQFDVIWFMGKHKAEFAAGLKAENFSKKSFISDVYELDLALKIISMLNDQDIAVIKGSRGMRMERVLEAWQKHAAAT